MQTIQSDALVTLDELRTSLGFAPGQRVELDGFLVLVINAVTQRSNAYCGRTLGRTTYANQLFDGDGTEWLALPHFPVDVSSSGVVFQLYVDLTRVFGSSSLLTRWDETGEQGTAQYRLIEEDGTIERLDSVFPVGSAIAKVNYTAGYTHDTALDVVMAQMEECKDWWARRGRDPSVQSGSLAGFSSTLRNDDLSPKVKAVLNAHSQGLW